MNVTLRLPIMIAALSLGVLAVAQTTVSKANGYPNKIGAPKVGLTPQDRGFIKDAAGGNQFEIKSSEVALKNGSSPFVKGFAKMMITDHGAAFEELKVVGTKKRVTVPKALPPKQAAVVKKLSGLHGAAFDAAYLKAQKDAHAETAMKMEKEIKTGHDAEAKNYAIKTLPAVKMHQKMLATKSLMGMHGSHGM